MLFMDAGFLPQVWGVCWGFQIEIETPDRLNLINYDTLTKKDDSLLDKLAVIKLNGGLGTSMGLAKAKSLLPVKGELNFLDIL